MPESNWAGNLTYSAEHQTDAVAARQTPSLTINVIASKWQWTFFYPAYRITIRASALTNVGPPATATSPVFTIPRR